jgi:hypothetical protein
MARKDQHQAKPLPAKSRSLDAYASTNVDEHVDGGAMPDLDTKYARGRSRPPFQKILRKKPRKRFRGVPPPLTFDLNALPDTGLLTETESAAACRRAKSTLEVWRKQKDHPLRWRRVAGRVLYEVSSIHAFLKGA